MLRLTSNTAWLLVDRVLRVAIGAVVGIWVARYLGPDQYGVLSYAAAFTGLFAAFAPLGLNEVVVRELVRIPHRKDTILGTAFALQLGGGLASFLAASLAAVFVRAGDVLAQTVICLLATIPTLNAFATIDFWFQSRVESKFSVLGKSASLLIGPALRIALIAVRAPLLWFALAAVVEALAAALGLVIVYCSTGESLRRWRFGFSAAKELLTTGWPLLVSGVAVLVYMRADQVMIGQMAGDRAAGLYAAAVRLSELWYFVPTTIVSSLFPVLVGGKQRGEHTYYRRFETTFRLMAALSVSVALFMSFASTPLVVALFGKAYAEAGAILAIHVWAGVAVSMGVATSPWLVNEGLTQVILEKSVFGALVNIALCLLLIPRYDGVGAAIATVVSYTASTLLWHVLDPRTRRVGTLQVLAFLPPLLKPAERTDDGTH